ncbi:sugar phosphate isomerase/epimerase family protein [Paenibacillus thailandensis]|uniref:Sugar phosphate isomerase/epimerase family protein n=1 Tax=Paenibacillus thailandensis TaxID=393250 RepID=A0ABW5R431_9BACL
MVTPTIGIQMSMLRNEAEIDFLGTLKKIKDIGYEAVEFDGFYRLKAKKVKAALEDYGLIGISAHTPLNYENQKKIVSDLKKQADYVAEVGIPYMISPWFPLPKKPIMADVDQYVDIVRQCSDAVREAGLQFGFCHLDGELKSLGKGKRILEEVLKRTSPEEMVIEFDLGWLKYADVDMEELLGRYAGRAPIVHFRDYKVGHIDTEVGEGVVGYDKLLPLVAELDIPYIIVKQTQFDRTPIESAKKSFAFFQRAGYARG